MDSFFSFPVLFDDLHTKTISCNGTVVSNRKGMPKNFGHKTISKRGDINSEVRGNLTA